MRFVNRYRERPRRVTDRLFVSCGLYEPLIIPNRSIVPVFEAAEWMCVTSRPGTVTRGRTGATGCDALMDLPRACACRSAEVNRLLSPR